MAPDTVDLRLNPPRLGIEDTLAVAIVGVLFGAFAFEWTRWCSSSDGGCLTAGGGQGAIYFLLPVLLAIGISIFAVRDVLLDSWPIRDKAAEPLMAKLAPRRSIRAVDLWVWILIGPLNIVCSILLIPIVLGALGVFFVYMGVYVTVYGLVIWVLFGADRRGARSRAARPGSRG